MGRPAGARYAQGGVLGRSILLAESNIHHVPTSTSRLYVVERGEIVFAGQPQDARRDPTVLRIIGGAAL